MTKFLIYPLCELIPRSYVEVNRQCWQADIFVNTSPHITWFNRCFLRSFNISSVCVVVSAANRLSKRSKVAVTVSGISWLRFVPNHNFDFLTARVPDRITQDTNVEILNHIIHRMDETENLHSKSIRAKYCSSFCSHGVPPSAMVPLQKKTFRMNGTQRQYRWSYEKSQTVLIVNEFLAHRINCKCIIIFATPFPAVCCSFW